MKDTSSPSDKLSGEATVMSICHCNGASCRDFVAVGSCSSGMPLSKNIDVTSNATV